jgi:hypothetical protein
VVSRVRSGRRGAAVFCWVPLVWPKSDDQTARRRQDTTTSEREFFMVL